jgi:hypothetical protein
MSVEIAEEILRYYSKVRRIGHTTAMIEGAKSFPRCLVASWNAAHADDIRRMIGQGGFREAAFPNDVFPIASITRGNSILRSSRLPLVIDHFALVLILEALLADISNNIYRKKVTQIKEIVAERKDDATTLRNIRTITYDEK